MRNENSLWQVEDLPSPAEGAAGWPWAAEIDSTVKMAAHWPRISIVTPSYNQAQFLEQTIRSVLLQGYPNLEYIIMDGGSSDGSVAILHRYERFLAHLSIEKDEGQAAAIAKGFALASGDILAWLNSDDLYLPGALFRAADFFSSYPDQVFTVGDVQVIDAQSQPVGAVWGVTPNVFLTSNSGAHGWPQPGAFWRREAYKAVGGVDPSLRFCMDRDLFIRICQRGKASALPGPPVAAFRQHEEQKSHLIVETSRLENELLLERYGRWELRPLRFILNQAWRVWARYDRLRR